MTSIAFIVNGDHGSAMGHRARALASRLQGGYAIHIAYRDHSRPISLLRFVSFLRRVKPQVTYVFDMSYAGVCAAWLYKLLARNRLIIETGDAIYELTLSTGSRGALGLLLTEWFEKFSLRVADDIVVRGHFHQQWLRRMGYRAQVIQDGVDTREFTPMRVDELRQQYGLDGELTVGLVGSSIWSEQLQMCYGWELVETLRLLKDQRVRGIMIGNGSGIPHLKARCEEYGIEDRMVFLNYVPYEQLPRYLNLIDVCLSTQTNDLVGQVRTTGKLPLYLAAGRYILASRVGEASLILDKEMLVDYEGVKDQLYARKLAERITNILQHPEILGRGAENPALAKQHFDYSILAERLHQCLERTISERRNNR